MNIRMQHESRGSIFRRWDERNGGILRIKDLLMRGNGCGASNAGLEMAGITGRYFWTTERVVREKLLFRGIMMRHCAGPSLLRLERNNGRVMNYFVSIYLAHSSNVSLNLFIVLSSFICLTMSSIFPSP